MRSIDPGRIGYFESGKSLAAKQTAIIIGRSHIMPESQSRRPANCQLPPLFYALDTRFQWRGIIINAEFCLMREQRKFSPRGMSLLPMRSSVG